LPIRHPMVGLVRLARGANGGVKVGPLLRFVLGVMGDAKPARIGWVKTGRLEETGIRDHSLCGQWLAGGVVDGESAWDGAGRGNSGSTISRLVPPADRPRAGRAPRDGGTVRAPGRRGARPAGSKPAKPAHGVPDWDSKLEPGGSQVVARALGRRGIQISVPTARRRSTGRGSPRGACSEALLPDRRDCDPG
jgi:hypothetical protein